MDELKNALITLKEEKYYKNYLFTDVQTTKDEEETCQEALDSVQKIR